MTLMLLRLDLRQRLIVYCSAGHPSGYILSASGSVKAVLESTAIPLGVNPSGSFPAAPPAQLDPGDAVLRTHPRPRRISMHPHGTPFGTELALEVVRAHHDRSAREIVQALYDAVLSLRSEQLIMMTLPQL